MLQLSFYSRRTIVHLAICLAMALQPFWGHAQRNIDIYYNINDLSLSVSNGLAEVGTSLRAPLYSADTSKPAFPYFNLNLLLPEDSSDIGYEVSFEKMLLVSNISVKTNSPAVTTNGKVLGTTSNLVKSIMNPVTGGRVIDFGDYHYKTFITTPFLFDATTGNLYYVNHIRITIPGLPAEEGSSDIEDWPLSARSFAEDLSNPGDLASFYSPSLYGTTSQSEPPLDYLIITSPALAESFKDLAYWKMRKGCKTSIVTTDSIYSMPDCNGIDNQQRIKKYLAKASASGVRFVLLGGDDSVIPVRYCSFPENLETGLTPADMYYACCKDLKNGDWDSNGNGVYGEIDDEVNYSQEVYLSRLPVRTPSQVVNYTDKLIRYETSPGSDEANRLLLTGKFSSMTINGDSKTLNEKLYSEYIQQYWSGEKYCMYENEGSLPDGSNLSTNVLNLFNEIDRGYNLIHEFSHGFPAYWMLSNTQNYTVTHASAQTNQHPSVIVTVACLTNAFDAEPCLSEAFIRNPDGGAVAYFGSSREGMGGENGEILGSFMYNGYFFMNLFNGRPYDAPYSFGAVASEAKMKMIDKLDNYDHNRSLQASINPIGDPEMEIYTSVPQSFQPNPTTAPILYFGQNHPYLRVKSPVGGCKFVLLDEAGNMQRFYDAQDVVFNVDYGKYKLSILKHNYVPYLMDVSIDSIPSLPGPVPDPIINLSVRKESNNSLYITAYKTVYVEDECGNMGETIVPADDWNLRIVNLVTGETVVNTDSDTSTYTCPTTSWESGTYVIRAQDEDSSAQTKFVITK